MYYRKSWQDSAEQNLQFDLEGKLCFGKFQELQSEIFDLKDNPPKTITFNLENVDMIDSSGLGLLIVANEITGHGKNVTLKYPSEQIVQLLDVCRMEKLMNIVR